MSPQASAGGRRRDHEKHHGWLIRGVPHRELYACGHLDRLPLLHACPTLPDLRGDLAGEHEDDPVGGVVADGAHPLRPLEADDLRPQAFALDERPPAWLVIGEADEIADVERLHGRKGTNVPRYIR